MLFDWEQRPEAFLDEISDLVTNIHQLLGEDVAISPSSVSGRLTANGLTRKVIETVFITRSDLDRARWVLHHWETPLRVRIDVDEAHRCGRSADGKWVWSLRGRQAECYLTNSWGVSTSFFFSMSVDQVLEWKITKRPPGRTYVDFLLSAAHERVCPFIALVPAGRALCYDIRQCPGS